MVKLLDMWAPWCQPCHVMNPIIDEIEKELAGKIEVIRINVDEKPEEASKFGVMSIPTYIILKDDKEVGRKIGVTVKQELLELLKS
ncbi:MAG: thioredoxin domain-containing protein [Patescibacteria group bacterium]